MALHHADSGELVDIQPLGPELHQAISTTLVRSDRLEVFRLVMRAGERVPDRKLPRNFQLLGQSTVQCIEGEVELKVNDQCHLLRPGSLMYLDAGEVCALRAIQDSSILVTLLKDSVERETELLEPQPAAGLAAAPAGIRRG